MHKSKQPHNSISIKGQKTSARILTSAEKLLLGKGYRSLSMRNIAEAAGISIGNVQYYFPSRDILIKALLDKIIQAYLEDIDFIKEEASEDPEAQFILVISYVLKDLTHKKTTCFFPELWALANHAKYVTQLIDDMYAQYRNVIEALVLNINKKLTSEQARTLTLFITSSIEGHTIFIGYGKPWKKDTSAIIEIATKSFLHVIKNP